MNIERFYYGIIGYDLTGYETDKFEKWRLTDKGKYYFTHRETEEIQLFYGKERNLYLGYIILSINQYGYERTDDDDLNNISNIVELVKNELNKLKYFGIIRKDLSEECCYLMLQEQVEKR